MMMLLFSLYSHLFIQRVIMLNRATKNSWTLLRYFQFNNIPLSQNKILRSHFIMNFFPTLHSREKINKKRGVQPFLINGGFRDGTCSEPFDIFVGILSYLWPIKLPLQYYYYIFHIKVPCHPTIMIFPNHLFTLSWRNTKITQMSQ